MRCGVADVVWCDVVWFGLFCPVRFLVQMMLRKMRELIELRNALARRDIPKIEALLAHMESPDYKVDL